MSGPHFRALVGKRARTHIGPVLVEEVIDQERLKLSSFQPADSVQNSTGLDTESVMLMIRSPSCPQLLSKYEVEGVSAFGPERVGGFIFVIEETLNPPQHLKGAAA